MKATNALNHKSHLSSFKHTILFYFFFFIKVGLQLDLPLFVKRQTLVIEAGNLSVPEISVIRNAFFTSADYIRRSHVFR